jgi:hypothetical protein
MSLEKKFQSIEYRLAKIERAMKIDVARMGINDDEMNQTLKLEYLKIIAEMAD